MKKRSEGRRTAPAPAPRLEDAEPPVPPFRLRDHNVPAGSRKDIDVPVSRLATGEWIHLGVQVVHGRRPGPRVWLTGAIHGDELDGSEIIRRVLQHLDAPALAGTVVGVPVVNAFGLVAESRYLPDRRDLNRSFPGRDNGSMAAQLAHLVMRDVVHGSGYGVDFHCGSGDRENLPQVRADLKDPETAALAEAFAAPVSIDGKGPEGSLRRAAVARGVKVLLYEGGEAGRFTEPSIRAGVAGALRVLHRLGMIDTSPPAAAPTVRAGKVHWVRAPRSGVARIRVALGESVRNREPLGDVADLLGKDPRRFRARTEGVVIGRRVHPLVYRGDALVHIAAPE